MVAHHVQDPARVNAAVPDVRELDQHMKLIRKLRWIGCEDEAKRLQQTLRVTPAEDRRVVSAHALSAELVQCSVSEVGHTLQHVQSGLRKQSTGKPMIRE
jgi:hypothetical protein